MLRLKIQIIQNKCHGKEVLKRKTTMKITMKFSYHAEKYKISNPKKVNEKSNIHKHEL